MFCICSYFISYFKKVPAVTTLCLAHRTYFSVLDLNQLYTSVATIDRFLKYSLWFTLLLEQHIEKQETRFTVDSTISLFPILKDKQYLYLNIWNKCFFFW